MLDGLLRDHMKLNVHRITHFGLVHSSALKRDPIVFDIISFFKSSKSDL